MEGLPDYLESAAPAKQYRIGEIADYTGVSRQTVHNYTVMGLIRETCWTRGGHRLYDQAVFEQLSRIEQLKVSRSLREIRTLFDAEKHEKTPRTVNQS